MSDRPPQPLLVIAGATASGKSSLAMALAERLPVELISADSAQVYRGMDIGTAKPSAAERAAVPHHLLDVCDPADPYSAARFAEDAAKAIADVRSRGKLPVLVGGTLLYLKALLNGLSLLPSSDVAVRAQLMADAERLGVAALHARLSALDPETGARLHVNDWQRIQRALEIIMLTGKPVTAAYRSRVVQPDLGVVVRVAVTVDDRSLLHQRIEQRFMQMMDEGLLHEVERLYQRGDLHPALPSIRSVGYRQLWAAVSGDVELTIAVTQAIAATRQLAKRQLTWLRNEPGWQPLSGTLARQLDSVISALNAWRKAPSQAP